MKKVMIVTLLALSFTTGFTCSKQTPDSEPTQEQMGAPAEGMGEEAPPMDGTMPPAEGTPSEGSGQ